MVAAAIIDSQQRVLLAERPKGKHLAGFWEFPGGKLESNELRVDGLRRELIEELGLEVDHARPLIAVNYVYPEKNVRLDVWRIDQFRGVPHGREGQNLSWVPIAELDQWRLPPADHPVVTALKLPTSYVINPPWNRQETTKASFLKSLEQTLASGAKCVQLRVKNLLDADYIALALEFIACCRRHNAIAILNWDPVRAADLGADGAQVNAMALAELTDRPVPRPFILGASCHNGGELKHAAQLEFDYALLGPVKPTLTHPGQPALGWRQFENLVRDINIPVYALGGMQHDDLASAWLSGGQGVAGIRGLWIDATDQV